MILRDYQRQAIDSLYEWFRENDTGNPCLVLPTGAGKSVVLAEFCREALANWPDTRILILSHVKELLEQDAEKIRILWPDAPLGVYSAGLGRRDVDAITVAGIQSVYRKASEIGYVDIAIVDECHLLNHKDEGMYRNLLNELEAINPSLRVIGLTATPYRLGHGLITEGGAMFSALIEPVRIQELVERGYLAPLRSKGMELLLSVDGVRRRGGDFVESELAEMVNTKANNEAMVGQTLRIAQGRRSILVFCSGVQHAYAMRDLFREKGEIAEAVLGETDSEERARILEDFKAGRVRVITNNSVLCLDEETEILTSDGFVGIDVMSDEHLIAGWKCDGKIEFAPPKQIVKRNKMPNEKMVVFKSHKSTEIRVTENHRMVVQCGRNRSKIKVVPAESLVGKRFSIPVLGYSAPMDIIAPTPKQLKSSVSRQVIANSYNYRKKGDSKETARKKAEYLALKRMSMKYKNPKELSLWECQFIGFWLGDGTLSAGRMSITQSMGYRDTVEKVEEIFKKCGLHYTKSVTKKRGNMKNDAVRWSFSRGTGGDKQDVSGGFFPLEPYLKKNGTKLFLGLSKEQLDALLYGLWLADGIHHGRSSRKNKFIAGTQFDLYNILQAACAMRGIPSTISKLSLPRKENHSQQWAFAWGGNKSIHFLKNKSQVEEEFKEERVWCVTSTTSFLICRRRGKVFVTGNSTGFDAPNTDVLVMARPTDSVVLYIQSAGRGMRPKEHVSDCLLLDFAGNVRRHGPITDVIPPKRKGDKKGEAPVKLCEQCNELVHLSAKVCPACGWVFPPPPPKRYVLGNEDIMGGPSSFGVEEWRWRVHTAASGKELVRVTYYGHSDSVDEYLCLLHGGYAAQKALSALKQMERSCGVTVGNPYDLDEVVETMQCAVPPKEISIQREGKYHRVVGKVWG